MKFFIAFIYLLTILSVQSRIRKEPIKVEAGIFKLNENLPQQLHINFGSSDSTSVVVTFSTGAQLSAPMVYYGLDKQNLNLQASPVKINKYTFNYKNYPTYTSNFIYHTNLTNLQPGATYYYQVGDQSAPGSLSALKSFKMPPAVGPETPFIFGIVGDIGQTENSNSTLQRILSDDEISLIIHAGDISYADGDQTRWDSYQILAEPLSSQKFTHFVPGNHEVEVDSKTKQKFTAYQNRFMMPSQSSGATEGNLYYSFEVAGAHWLMLGSYADFSERSKQYEWILNDLQSIDRIRTPWVFAVLHAPWYNSNQHHQNEKEEVEFKALYEDIFNQYQVDMVIHGHVHAYERNYGVYKGVKNESAPIYITIGDGGNREGLADPWLDQPEYSAYRESSYGHAKLKIFNSTYAEWGWHRNQDDINAIHDQVIIQKKVVEGKRTLQYIKNGKLETGSTNMDDLSRSGPSRTLSFEEIHRTYL